MDEAQSIKNPRTLVFHAACSIKAMFRWCLTGTPLQNSLEDLFSYCRFLRFKPYCNQEKFKILIRNPIIDQPKFGFKKLRSVLRTILLRRTKNTLLNGTPILSLPPRKLELIRLKFSPGQLFQYKHLFTLMKNTVDLLSYSKSDNWTKIDSSIHVNILNLVLKMRQTCNFPLLSQKYWTKLTLKLRLRYRDFNICRLCGKSSKIHVIPICQHNLCLQCAKSHGLYIISEYGDNIVSTSPQKKLFFCSFCRTYSRWGLKLNSSFLEQHKTPWTQSLDEMTSKITYIDNLLNRLIHCNLKFNTLN